MKTSAPLLTLLLVLTAGPAVAQPSSKGPRAAGPRVRPLPVLGEDAALRGRGAKGYPAVVIGEPPRRWRGEPISLDLKDADIRDVLLTFSRLARFNMVIDPDVRGSVTVRLENVPWDQALEVILKVNGLGYVLEGLIVRVAAASRL